MSEPWAASPFTYALGEVTRPLGTLSIVLLLLAGCSEQSSHVAPLVVPQNSTIEGGGPSIQSLGPREIAVDHSPGQSFGIGFIVKNRSKHEVTITRVVGTDSGKRLVTLIGADVSPYTRRPCSGLCPPPTGVLGRRPYADDLTFSPVTLKPGRLAGVALQFRGTPCNAAPRRATETDNRVLRVEFETEGHRGTDLLSTGPARLSVASNACGAQAASS